MTIIYHGQAYELDGQGFIFDEICRSGAFYELPLLQFIEENYPPGFVAVDAGANIGNHAVFFAGVCGAKVLAFEPVQANYAYLEKNAAPYSGIEMYRLGLGATAGLAGAYAPNDWNPGAIRLIPNRTVLPMGPLDIELEEVKLVTLDAMTTELWRLDLIKADVEGMEAQVLEGGLSTLRHYQPDLFVEAHNGNDRAKVASVVLELGYELVRRFPMQSGPIDLWKVRR